jgi:hypothetical protein
MWNERDTCKRIKLKFWTFTGKNLMGRGSKSKEHRAILRRLVKGKGAKNWVSPETARADQIRYYRTLMQQQSFPVEVHDPYLSTSAEVLADRMSRLELKMLDRGLSSPMYHMLAEAGRQAFSSSGLALPGRHDSTPPVHQ